MAIIFRMRGRKIRGVRRVKPSKKGGSGRRRLMDTELHAGQPVRNVVRGVAKAGKFAYRAARRYVRGRKWVGPRQAQKNFNNRLQSDNVQNAPTFKVGSPRKLGFAEKVDRITNPPQTFKRNYAWSAECNSGRKAMFGIPINKLSNVLYGDLFDDAISGIARLQTETTQGDVTVSPNQASGQRAYVDYLSEHLSMVNSSSNSLFGKVYLYKYKRDVDALFTNTSVPMTPINLMMFGSTNNIGLASASYEASVGNGWKFDGTLSTYNYNSNYDMPGSSINTTGVCAHMDPELQVHSRHIKEFTSYYFDLVNSFDFSLKPGQQIKHWTIFNDLPNIIRQHQDMTYLQNISFYLVVEFQGQIVGDSTLTTGDNNISSGSCQLSCILEEKRIIGTRSKSKGGKVWMFTPPLATIAKAAQYTINPDTGVADVGEDEDA